MNADTSVDYWGTIGKTAKAVAGGDSEVVVDKSFGTISVTGAPPQIERVAAWVKDLKEILTKQVAIEVKIYNVQLTGEENYGLNPTALINSSAKNLNLTSTPVSLPTVLGGQTPMSFGATVLSGVAQGSNVAVQALSTLGHVTQVFSRTGVTINGQMLALQSANVQNYLASSQTTLAAAAGAMTTLTPGMVVTGFTGSFMPKVVDGRIYVDFNLTISNLVSLSTFTTGSGASASSIQLPQVVSTTLQQIVGMKPGQTLILTGYRDKNAHTISNGTITPENYAFGGGVDSTSNDNVLAVVITAKLL